MKSYPMVSSVRGCSIFFLSLGLLTGEVASAGVQKSFFQGDDLSVPANYNPSGVPSSSSDVILTTPASALHLDAATLSLNTLNITASNVSYTISNNSSDSTSSFLSFSMAGSNSVSTIVSDTIYLGGANSNLTIQATNGGSGSGGMSLGFNAAANFDVAQASSTLNVYTPIITGTGGALSKNGVGTLNLGGSFGTFSGSLNIAGGVTNLLSSFTAGQGTNLNVSNLASAGAADVVLNIQTSVQFRSLNGSITNSANHATINLVGAGTTLNLFQPGGTFSGVIAGGGSVAMTGALTQTFAGNNTYTGTTTSNSTSVRVTGTTSGQGNYTISGANLLGTGTIGLALNGTITLQYANSQYARIAPGEIGSIGTLSVATSGTGGVILSFSALTIDVGGAGSSDLLAITGGYLDLTGGSGRLELNALAGAFDGSTYTIATFGQNLAGGTFANISGLPANYAVSYQPNAIRLLPVPEPGPLAFLGEILLLVCWVRKTKKPLAYS